MAAAACLLCDMPDEVINTIIAMLDDVKPVLRLSQTSHWFASRASRPELWRKLLQDHWGAAAVEEFGNAASCARTFFARTRVIPTSLQDAELETAWAPERFVPMPFSEYHMLVEIMHQGRAVLTQALQPASGMSSFDLALLQRDFPARDSAPVSRDPWPSALAVGGALNNLYRWSQDVEAFFSHDWAARLCVVHAPSGRVVCLGVEGGQCQTAEHPQESSQPGTPPTQGSAELEFFWRLPTRFLPDAVFDEIDQGLSVPPQSDPGEPTPSEWLLNWDAALGRNVADTKGVTVILSAHLKLKPGGQLGSAEVWEWDYFRVESEPVLAFHGCDAFHYNNWSHAQHHYTDHMLRTFLHAAVHHIGAA